MKIIKNAPLILLIAFAAVLLVSCTSTNLSAVSTDAEKLHTLDVVLRSSQPQAVTTLFQSLNSFREDMIPEEYSFLRESRSTAPGLDRILSQWAHSTISYLIPRFDSFSDYTQRIVFSMEFKDPGSMISSGNDSISRLVKELFLSEMTQSIRDNLGDLDLTLWHEAVIQYNAWVNTSALLNLKVGEPIGEDATDEVFLTQLSEHLANLYISSFAKAEILIRTTPDPDMDSIVSAVLGFQ